MLLVAWEWVGSCCQHDIMSAHVSAHRRSRFLTWWLLSTTICAQCKKDNDGNYPATPADIKSARPISRLAIFRRLMARHGSPGVCKALVPILEPWRQYGLSPSG